MSQTPDRCGHDPNDRVPRDRIDLWYVDAAVVDSSWLDGLAASLSPDEVARAGSFLRPRDAQLYRMAHGLLRHALTHYFDRPASAWRFAASPGGKPTLAEPPPVPLDFSLSHSAGLAVCAVSGLGPIGVDVEGISRAAQVLEVASARFHATELRWLATFAAPERDERAVWLWTAREALLKACGLGLAVPAQSLALGWDPPGEPQVLEAGPEVGREWTLIPLRLAPGHVGTVVVPRRAGGCALRALRLDSRADGPEVRPLGVAVAPGGYREITGPPLRDRPGDGFRGSAPSGTR